MPNRIRKLLSLLAVLAFIPCAVFAESSGKEKAPLSLEAITQKTWRQMRRAPTATRGLDKILSLEDCLKIAKENSGKLIVARDRLKAAKMAYGEKKRALLPPLGIKFNAKEGILPGDTPPQGAFKGLGGKLISDFPILDGGAKFLSLEQAKNTYRQTRLSLQQTESELGFTVRSLYYQLAQAALLLDLQKSLLARAVDIGARAEAMAKKNLIKPSDRTELRLRLKEIEVQTKALEHQYLLLQTAMKQAMNVYPDHALQVRTDLGYVEPPVSLDEALRLTYQNKPDLLRLYYREDSAKIARDTQRALNGMNVSINTEIGMRGEAFSSATEGLQTRIDANMGIKFSVPFGPHTLKYEPKLVKQVPDVGQTTPTDYNEHTGTLELDNNTGERSNLEARIAYHDVAEDLDTVRKSAATEIGNTMLSIEQVRNMAGRAQFDFQLAQQRLQIMQSQAGAGSGVPINDELSATLAASEAAKRLVNARYELFNQFNALNRSVGIEGYWDPHTGSAQSPTTAAAGPKQHAFWRDELLEEDDEILNSPSYEDYLRPAGLEISWNDFINSSDKYPLLHFAPEYPKLVAHGEIRTRLQYAWEGMDLGANIKPVAVPAESIGIAIPGRTITLNPASFVVPAQYLEIRDKYAAYYQRFLGTLEWKLDRETTAVVTMRNDNNNFAGYKAPREMSLMPLRKQSYATKLDELYLTKFNFIVDGLALRVGRQYLDYDLGFFEKNSQKEFSFDVAQLTYTNNPWQIAVDYDHPTLDKQHRHFQLENSTDLFIGYVRYKADTWRYTFSYFGRNEDDKFVAPQSFFNQLLWDPTPAIETETAVVYQLGKLQNQEDQRLSSFGMNLVLKYKTDLPLKPQFRMEFIMAQGAKEGAKKDFGVLSTDVEYGYVVQAALTNLYMIHPSVSLQVSKNSTLTFNHYYFSQYRSRVGFVSDPGLDNGGIFIPTNGVSKDIGHEFSAVHEIALLNNLKSQMYVAWFLPGHAYGNVPDLPFPGTGWQETPMELRWQLLFNF